MGWERTSCDGIEETKEVWTANLSDNGLAYFSKVTKMINHALVQFEKERDFKVPKIAMEIAIDALELCDDGQHHGAFRETVSLAIHFIIGFALVKDMVAGQVRNPAMRGVLVPGTIKAIVNARLKGPADGLYRYVYVKLRQKRIHKCFIRREK